MENMSLDDFLQDSQDVSEGEHSALMGLLQRRPCIQCSLQERLDVAILSLRQVPYPTTLCEAVVIITQLKQYVWVLGSQFIANSQTFPHHNRQEWWETHEHETETNSHGFYLWKHELSVPDSDKVGPFMKSAETGHLSAIATFSTPPWI